MSRLGRYVAYSVLAVVGMAGGLTVHAQQGLPAPAATAAAPVAVQATPALWVMKGPKATVYLLGTIHIMKPGVEWHTAKVMAAVNQSQTLVEEVADLSDVAAIRPLMMQLGMDQEHPLSTKITKEDLALVDGALKQMGAPGESSVEPMRPWLVGLTLSVLPLMKAGYDPQSGVDMTLSKEFKAAGKPVAGLETVEQQLHILADLPLADEVESLHLQLKDLDHATADTEKTVAAWEKGDVATIAKIENDEFVKEYPALYQKLVVARNKAWAEKLATMLQGEGTTLVAVGAAHLAGPDSVQTLLTAKGFTVTGQ